MKCKDVPAKPILEYLYDHQGEWTGLWCGHFKGGPNKCDPSGPNVTDVYYAMPEGTPEKVALRKMQILHKAGLVGGCPCGCRGDFEITDKGLEYLGKPRLKEYSGY